MPAYLFGGRTYGGDVFAKVGPDGKSYVLLKEPAGGGKGSVVLSLYRHTPGENDAAPEKLCTLDGVKHGGGSFDFRPDGAVIIYAAYRKDDSYAYGYQIVPGVVAPFAPGGGGGSSSAAVDAVARASATAAANSAANARAVADGADAKATQALRVASTAADRAANALASVGALPTVQQVQDIAWSKAGDRIFAELQNSGSPLMATIWQKALDAAYAFAKEQRARAG